MQTTSCDSAAPPLWGVLVANTAPTFESGLLTFAQARYRAFRSAVVHGNGALSKDVFATPGDAWLWTCLPPPQRSKHFPLPPPHVEKSNDKSSTGGGPAATGASAPSNGGKPDGVAALEEEEAALEEEEAAYTSLRLLLPLCSARHAGQVTIGRLDSNDIALEGNPCISSVHCAVSFQPRSTREAASWGDSAASQQATQDAVVRAIAQHHGKPMHTPSPSDHRAKVTDRTDPCSLNSCDVPLKATQERAGATQRGDGAPSQTAGPCTTANTNTAPARIVLSDYSRNGCLVNGRQVGQGKSANLHSGDTVELVYGGHNHRTDYNLAFTFYTVDGFLEWLSRQQQQQQQQLTGSPAKEEGSEGIVHTEIAAAAAAAKKKRSDDQRVKQQSLRRQRDTAARRHALLSRAQWNVEAQVRRMYAHRVDEFYALDHANPLGKGSFGVVYRAALRTDAPPHASGRHHAPSLSAVTARILAQAGLAAGKEASGKGVSRGNSSDTPVQQQQQQLQLFSPAAACIWTTNPALEAQLAEAYTREKEQRPPAAVLQAANAAATAVTPGSPSVSLPVPAAASPAPYVFAVKVIRKQRMLLDVLQQQQHDDTESAISNNNNNNNNNNGNAIPTTSISALTAAEVAVIQQLAQLETQPADLAEQRQEEWIAGALASLQLSDTAGALGSCGGFAQGSMGRAMEHFSQALTASTQEGANAQEWLMSHPVAPASSSSTPLSSSSCPSPSSSAAQQRREQRLQRRRQLLSYLPVPLRRAYERELNHRRRQQCEINILLAVRHPCVTSLFEVFDQPDQLALVMEQATGGELFDLLLSRYKRRRRQRRGVKQAREEAEKEVVMSRRGVAATAAASTQQHAPTPAHHQEQQQPAEGEEDDANGEAFAAEDSDLIGSGGPLPEYLVKIIIVQVLEAVLYLHTMGIIHRDLKLENLMLHRPCDRYALNALQLQMFLQQLREYERATRQQQQHRPSNNAHVFSERGEAAFSSRMMEEVEFSNPLSALYTVHIPRALWPVVKVTDFGLSRVLDQLQTRPSSSSSSSTTVETLHGFTAASRTSEAAGGSREVPERVKLIYARNDATTSCGTPIYAAPEICDPSLRPNRVGYGAAVDMYSVGVIAYALLTGRSPFSTRQDPRRPDKRPVVDYDGPLRFDRHRQAPPAAKQSEGKDNNKVDTAPVQQQQQQAARRHTITSTIAEEPAVFLPSLAVLESIRVPFPPPAATPSDGTAAGRRVNERQFEERGGEGGKKKGGKAPEATAHTERWRQHVDAFAERFRLVEDESLLQQRADQCASTSSTRPPNSLFHTVVHKLIQSLKNYADGCALHDEEVDLDRLVYVSLLANAASGRTARADGGGLWSSSSSPPLTDVGRLLDENGHVGRVSLPPVSALAASFLRGLLEKYPLQRLTAYEALQHPWLRECVAAEPAQSPD